jgi:hypothetical protein
MESQVMMSWRDWVARVDRRRPRGLEDAEDVPRRRAKVTLAILFGPLGPLGLIKHG